MKPPLAELPAITIDRLARTLTASASALPLPAKSTNSIPFPPGPKVVSGCPRAVRRTTAIVLVSVIISTALPTATTLSPGPASTADASPASEG